MAPTTPEDFTIPGTLDGADGTALEKAERDNQAIISQLRKDFEKRNELYGEIEAAVFYENDVYVPTDYAQSTITVHNPLPSHIVNTVVAALTKNGAKVQFPPVKGGDKGQENAELRAAFFEASARRQEEDSANRWLRMFMSALVMKGEGVLKTLERKKLAWSDYNAYTRQLAAKLDDPDDEDYRDIVWRRRGGSGPEGNERHQDEGERKRIFMAKTEEYKRGAPYPITTTDVLPETTVYMKTAEGFSFFGEVKEVPYADTLARYGAGLTSSGRVVAKEAMGLPRSEWQQAMEGLRTLTMYETWTGAGECCYWLAGPGEEPSGSGEAKRGTLVKKLRHRYGDRYTKTLRGPYSHALGITTHNRLPHRAGLGILYGFLPLFKLLDSYLTMQSNVAFQTAYAGFRQKQGGGLIIPGQSDPYGDDNASGTVRAPTQRVIPGRVLPWDVEPINLPSGGPALDKVIADTRAFIELALPSVVQGVVSGDESGYALNQAAALARLSWAPIIDGAEFALSQRVGFESWMIEHCIQETVYVWGEQRAKSRLGRRSSQAGWLSIGPDDLQGVHRYTVRLDPETPSNRAIETRTHAELVKNRFETRDDAILALGGSPEEVERWWMVDDFKNDPAIKQLIRERALRKLELKVQEEARGGPGEHNIFEPEPGAMPPGVGEVYDPAMDNMPAAPTPNGARTAMGPAGAALVRGNAPGTATIQAPPARHLPLPGER